jgi:hypothetical protein
MDTVTGGTNGRLKNNVIEGFFSTLMPDPVKHNGEKARASPPPPLALTARQLTYRSPLYARPPFNRMSICRPLCRMVCAGIAGTRSVLCPKHRRFYRRAILSADDIYFPFHVASTEAIEEHWVFTHISRRTRTICMYEPAGLIRDTRKAEDLLARRLLPERVLVVLSAGWRCPCAGLMDSTPPLSLRASSAGVMISTCRRPSSVITALGGSRTLLATSASVATTWSLTFLRPG